MKKFLLGFFLALLAFLLCSCTTDNENPGIFTIEEFFSFEFLNSNITKEQMEELGLKKEVNEIAGETYYSNNFIKYTFMDWYSDTLFSADVFGEYTGPRGIKIGDDFEYVLSLFPQDKDWQASTHGEFYGQIYETEEWEAFGSASYWEDITTGDNKQITLSVGNGAPFLRIFFKDDLVTHYTFYLIGT